MKETMHADTNKISFSQLALSLANDYDSIYVVSLSDDSYAEYSAVGTEKKLELRSSGDNFFEDLIHNCHNLVYIEDQQDFINAFKKERVLRYVKSGKSFTLNYRLLINGIPRYYYLKTIRGFDNNFLVGVRNVDEQKRHEKIAIAENRTYLEITESLASIYETIFHIDITTSQYTQYDSGDDFSSMVKIRHGSDFNSVVKEFILKNVYTDDVKMVTESLNRSVILDALKKEKSYGIVYRRVIDGKPHYVNLIAFRQINDSERFVIAIRDIDAQKKRDAKNEAYMQISAALSSRYEIVFYIDAQSGKYVTYALNDKYKHFNTSIEGDDFFADAEKDIKKYIDPDDRSKVLHALKKENLLNVIRGTGSISLPHRILVRDSSEYVNMFIISPENDPNHIVIGVLNVDAQVRRNLKLESQNHTFNEIATALAQRYEVIYHINIETDEYMEYSSSPEYSRLNINSKGYNFFGEAQKHMKIDIYKDDYPMMAEAMRKEKLLDNLKATGKTVYNYRLMLEGRPQYVTLFAVKPVEDSTHIIIAVANIDAAKRNEFDFQDAIGNAMDLASRDHLTGVKNKRAYAIAEMQMDENINSVDPPEFAVVVCDINGLKNVNDTLGHKAGDEYIKDACKIICSTFKHSPVYRIGGDEFVVFLKGSDFANRSSLISELHTIREKNRREGLVTFAYGISDFNSKIDLRVQDVFERADALMYKNKKQFKDNKPLITENNKAVLYREQPGRYYELFEKLIAAMSDTVKTDVALIERILSDLSSMFRLSKAVTHLYRNAEDEKKGIGETLCCYDTGTEGVPVLNLRVVSSIMSIATMTSYMSPDIEPLSDEEREKVELLMSATLSYIVRNRLKTLVDELAFYDDDGYSNRRSLFRYISKMNTESKVVLHYNLRHFTLVNQEFSKEGGDYAMRCHYNGLKKIIGNKGSVFRIGGDNFAAILVQEQLDAVLDYLNETVVYVDKKRDKTVNISCSVGVYVLPENLTEASPEDIFTRISRASRQAQTGGQSRVVYYDSSKKFNREKSMRVQAQFPKALRSEEFNVYYQPKVDIKTGELVGAEALCRWYKGSKILPPSDFIPMLEETNDICRLDFYILEHVCRDISRWIKEGRKMVRISVNMSRKHMMNISLLENITRIIDSYHIPHEYIEIELTETTTDVGFNDLKRIVNGLQKAGIWTSVDDFGIGYSSMNLIKDIPWNTIKIDKSLLPVENSTDNEKVEIMLKHVIAMAKQLGLECLAEGVESEFQLKFLKENGCDFVQGYYFDRPLLISDFEERLNGHTYNTTK